MTLSIQRVFFIIFGNKNILYLGFLYLQILTGNIEMFVLSVMAPFMDRYRYFNSCAALAYAV